MSTNDQVTPMLDDPLVLDMATFNHRPQEAWIHGAYAAGMTADVPVHISCEMCGQPWPCATRRAIRAKEEAQS